MQKIKEYINSFKDGSKTMLKEFFNKKTNKKQRANMWSFSRLLSAILNIIPVTIGLITGSFIPYIIALLISGYGAFTDYLDGKSARKYNSYSDYGKKLDQIADKTYALINGILISIINPLYLIPICLEGVIAAVNYPILTKYTFFSDKSLQIGRIKEWPLMISLALGYISTITPITYFISLGCIGITTPLQIKTAIDYHKRNKLQKNIYSINNEIINKKDNQLKIINQKSITKKINIQPEISIQTINDYKHRQQIINHLKQIKQELITYPSVKSVKTKTYKK